MAGGSGEEWRREGEEQGKWMLEEGGRGKGGLKWREKRGLFLWAKLE